MLAWTHVEWIEIIGLVAVAVWVAAWLIVGGWRAARSVVGYGRDGQEPTRERQKAVYARAQWWITSLLAASALWVAEREAIPSDHARLTTIAHHTTHAIDRAFAHTGLWLFYVPLNLLVITVVAGFVSHWYSQLVLWRERGRGARRWGATSGQQDMPSPPETTTNIEAPNAPR
jgi:hypothetical protein